MDMKQKINIKEYLNHRFPFLFVDGVQEVENDKICTIKNLSSNEHVFEGHFPGNPVFPGVLMVEAMAQSACIMIAWRNKGCDLNTYLTKIKDTVFKRLVLPGEQLLMEVRVISEKSIKGSVFFEFEGVATVQGELACKTVFQAVASVK